MSLCLEISHKRLTHNLHALQKRCGTKVKLCSSIKANAYGHGIVECAKTLVHAGSSYLGVSHVCEAIEICAHNTLKIPFILYGMAQKKEISLAFTNSYLLSKTGYSLIEFFVGDIIYLKEVSKIAKTYNCSARVHLKCDTGMGRLGTLPKDFFALYDYAYSHKNIEIIGICSHLSNSADNTTTQKQYDLFNTVIQDNIVKTTYSQKQTDILYHIGNSGVILWNIQFLKELARPGLALYGINPEPKRKIPSSICLKPVMQCISHIATIRHLPKGHCISYLSTYTKKQGGVIAVIAAGYGDGIPVSLSNTGTVCIKSTLFPIIGRICMDMLMVDLGKNKQNIHRGDTVTLWGNTYLNVESQAKKADTISYELLCNVGNSTRAKFIHKR